MTTDATYAVKFNSQQGTFEVTAPDGEWVATQVGELRELLATVPGPQAAPAPGGSAGPAAATDPPAAKQAATRDPKRRPRAAAGGRVRVDEQLRAAIDGNVAKKLGEYIEARRNAWNESLSAQMAIIATFLEDELGREGIDPSEAFTVYTVMGERPPANLRSALTNARQRARYFAAITEGRWQLSQRGQNFGRFDSLNSSDGQ